jgi:hypothetical protein
VEFCDGWFPRPRGFVAKEGVARLKAMADKMGRDASTLSITVFGAPNDAAALAEYEAQGIQRALLAVPDLDRDGILATLDKLAPLAAAHKS